MDSILLQLRLDPPEPSVNAPRKIHRRITVTPQGGHSSTRELTSLEWTEFRDLLQSWKELEKSRSNQQNPDSVLAHGRILSHRLLHECRSEVERARSLTIDANPGADALPF